MKTVLKTLACITAGLVVGAAIKRVQRIERNAENLKNATYKGFQTITDQYYIKCLLSKRNTTYCI